MKTIKVTELEKIVLEALAKEMYAEYSFSDTGIEEIQESTGLTNKVIRGVASSLIKKGYLFIDDREDEDYKNDPKMHIWYLTPLTEGLVKHWVEEADIEPVTLIC